MGPSKQGYKYFNWNYNCSYLTYNPIYQVPWSSMNPPKPLKYPYRSLKGTLIAPITKSRSHGPLSKLQSQKPKPQVSGIGMCIFQASAVGCAVEGVGLRGCPCLKDHGT